VSLHPSSSRHYHLHLSVAGEVPCPPNCQFPGAVRPAPRPVRTFCGFKVTAQLARRPRVLRLLPSAAKGGA
jgi:hypothetical protein